MDGKTHAAVGLATGIGIAYLSGLEFPESVAITAIATIASLAPDLDTAGRLTHRIIKPFRLVNGLAFSSLLFIILSTFLLTEVSPEMLIGGAGALITLFLLKRISIKLQLLMMAVVIGMIGYHFDYQSLMLFALFIGIASFLSHRSYTHSLIGLLFFSYISYKASIDLGMTKAHLAGTLGYASHLVLDSKLMPGNRAGIKILLPLRRPII